MDEFCFIVNPVSGSGSAQEKFNTARALLDKRGVKYTVMYTQRPYHAGELAKEAIEKGFGKIVAVGGDGTVNETASALVYTDAVLGVLPFGTGNDLAKVAGFPTDIEKAVYTLLNGRVRKMDAGMANDRFFANVAGFGFDVDVLLRTDKFKAKHPSGMTPYLLGIADALKHLKSLDMTIEHDGETVTCNGVIFSAGNGQYIGGGMRAVPMADPFDGLLDCVYIDKPSMPVFLALLPAFLKGKHIGKKPVHHFRTREVTVTSGKPSPLNLDGEVDGSTPVTFKVLPAALNVIVPSGDAL